MANATGGIEPEGGRIWKRPNSPTRRSTCATRQPPSACFHLSAALHPDLTHEGVRQMKDRGTQLCRVAVVTVELETKLFSSDPPFFNVSLLQLPYLVFATLLLLPEAPPPSPFHHSQIYSHTTEDFLSQRLLPPVVDLDLVLSASLCSPFSSLVSSLILLLLLSWLPFLNDW